MSLRLNFIQEFLLLPRLNLLLLIKRFILILKSLNHLFIFDKVIFLTFDNLMHPMQLFHEQFVDIL